MKLFYLLTIIMLAACSQAPLPEELQVALKAASNRQEAVNQYLTDLREANAWPLVVGDTVFYFYQGNPRSVRLTGDQFGWNPMGPQLHHLSGTDLFYLPLKTPTDAYLEYKFILNGQEWIIDPHNPNTNVGIPGEIPNSVLLMPDFESPAAATLNPNIPHGRLDTVFRDSTTYPELVEVVAYLPPGYDTTSVSYPTVYFHDGAEQITKAKAVNVLDNLIAEGRITPLIAIFTSPNDRGKQYAYDNRLDFARFFATTLVDSIDRRYRTITEAAARGVIGPSFGGHISVLTAYTYPAVFRHCGAISVSYWPHDRYLMDYVRERIHHDVNYVAVWGSFDGVDGNNQKMIDIFREEGQEMKYTVLPFGHTWKQWERANIIFLEDAFGG